MNTTAYPANCDIKTMVADVRVGCFRFYGAWSLFSLILALTLYAEPFTQPASFAIATKGVAMSMTSDGVNYLVGVENHQTTPTTVGAQLLSADGTKVGDLIPTGRSGIATALAFDGVNYLLIWEDDELGTLNNLTGWKVYGQFISRAGVAVGSPFAITTAGIWFDGIKTMAFGAGKYLVTYTRLVVPANGDASNNRYIAGRLVRPDGILSAEFRISTGYGKASDVAFDGSHFFVVWCEDENDREVRGRFVSPAGVSGAEVVVHSGLTPTDNPKSLAFDGRNYLVVWNEEVAGRDTGTWDCFGQLVSPSGNLVGSRITITSEPGPQMVTTVAFDGSHYFAVWTDMQNAMNWDVYGQFLSQTGLSTGGKIALSTEVGNQLGGAGFALGKHLVLLSNGVTMGAGGIEGVDSAVGTFVVPLPSPQIQVADGSFGVGLRGFGFNVTGPEGQRVVVELSSTLTAASWSAVQTNTLVKGSIYFNDPEWTNRSRGFYRLRSE